ncbi:MAG TPA: 4-hydroxyphenylacetate 3-monooxygenase, oxygenase component [Trueperaceae bacterium]|nr:4-hydroxyphenylacetate 3-monooxygenase, oxygenase component [Trueperaceae bacterium]
MAVRTGNEFLEGLRRRPPTIYLNGERVKDPTTHPATAGIARSIAELYDLQHRRDLVDVMTYRLEDGDGRAGMSFIETRTKEDLKRRSRMHKVWADHSLGFIGRSPDYLNVNLMAAARAADYFAQNDPRFGENIRNYYRYVRDNDLCLTHALTNPQVNRSVRADQLPDPYIALGLVQETEEGIVVRGARMLATLPIADEILIFPSTVLKEQEEMTRYALAFAVPTNTPGLSFVGREPLDLGRSHRDHPLGSRFDEMDALVVFDDVLVPWDRVFLMNDVKLANRAYVETGAVLHMAHQVVNVKIAKAEAFLGVAKKVVDAIGSDQFQHVQQKMAELIIVLEVLKALRTQAEETATVDRWGTMTPGKDALNVARNYFPQVYPRMVEVLQLLAASGLIMIPTEADQGGPMADAIDRFLQASNATAQERIQLFRLAWDMTISSFGGRQNLYEKFFFGDPVRTQGALYQGYDVGPVVERVDAFLRRAAEPREELMAAGAAD